MEPRRTKHPSPRLPKGATPAARRVSDREEEQDVIASLPQRASFIMGPDGTPREAIIPYTDYIQIIAGDMARRGEAVLDDPNSEWIELDDFITEFAAPKIAAAREKRGLTQKQLGAKLGMPQSQISRLEKHPESVTYRTLQRVAKALGMKVTELLA